MGAERERILSKPLHNFTLPLTLKWGNQRQLRCLKTATDDDEDHSAPSYTASMMMVKPRSSQPPLIRNNSSSRQQKRRRNEEEEEDGGGDCDARASKFDGGRIKGVVVREKIMMDLRRMEGGDKVKAEILRGKQPVETAAAAERPWNLRTRKGAVRIGFDGNFNLNLNNNKGLLTDFGDHQGFKANSQLSPEKEVERAKFSISLMRKEIEDDFMKMVGHRPPRRPKKRQRTVQRQMDNLFPGTWLREVTADDYKVEEVPETGKKPHRTTSTKMAMDEPPVKERHISFVSEANVVDKD
ncbi:hypothetical protein ACFE04_017695 [Oxalis oulophora]